ncbi:MAG: hypothetical protein QW117_00590 [Candidatus Pacearchaeota archaeon]
MQQKLLENAIERVIGKQAVNILKILENKKNVNEFLITKKLNLTINQVRNILYNLSNHRIVSFTRKKDNKKGWYTYYWTLDKKRCLEFLKKELEKEKNELINKLKSRETKRFYFCKTCVIDISEENALFNNFTCPECGNIYELKDNSFLINELKSLIEKKEKQIKNVEEEIKDLSLKEEKNKKRREAILKEKKRKDRLKNKKKIIKKSFKKKK